jgi:hypothetical protein
MTSQLSSLLYFYGVFLITCGVSSVLLIGPKAKTALASGGLSALMAAGIAYLIANGPGWAIYAAVVLPLCLFIVFARRASKTLFKVFELIAVKAEQPEVNKKAIAFLIISLMAVVSVSFLMVGVVLVSGIA